MLSISDFVPLETTTTLGIKFIRYNQIYYTPTLDEKVNEDTDR